MDQAQVSDDWTFSMESFQKNPSRFFLKEHETANKWNSVPAIAPVLNAPEPAAIGVESVLFVSTISDLFRLSTAVFSFCFSATRIFSISPSTIKRFLARRRRRSTLCRNQFVKSFCKFWTDFLQILPGIFWNILFLRSLYPEIFKKNPVSYGTRKKTLIHSSWCGANDRGRRRQFKHPCKQIFIFLFIFLRCKLHWSLSAQEDWELTLCCPQRNIIRLKTTQPILWTHEACDL